MAAPSSSFLFGKLALVTGGSGTIGQAIAKVLLSQGASVVLTARRMEKLEFAKETLQKEVDNKAAVVHVIASDVSKEESVVNLFQEIDQLVEHGKGLDLLVNNAGE
jgi:NAD(P)-dependent dehydrogenase (short-subunit alcohol dehydrogenase family)